jgi:hypothetical protein
LMDPHLNFLRFKRAGADFRDDDDALCGHYTAMPALAIRTNKWPPTPET